LCDLAMKAKSLGLFYHQLELSKQSVKTKPDDYWALIQYGDALRINGRFVEAIDMYNHSFILSESVVAKCGLAETLRDMGRLDDALVTYQEAVRIHPTDVVAKNGLAETLRSMGRLDDALVTYQEAVRIHPTDVVAKCGLAETLRSMGRLDDALVTYQEAVRIHPTDVVAKNGLACLLSLLGREEEALQALPTPYYNSTQYWRTIHVKGMIHIKTGNLKEARQFFEQGLNYMPWPALKDFFKTALALVNIHEMNYAMAIEKLNSVNNQQLDKTVGLLKCYMAEEPAGTPDCVEEFYEHKIQRAKKLVNAVFEELIPTLYQFSKAA